MNTMIAKDYQIVKKLGKGSFGKVLLVKKKDILYAIKEISKARLQKDAYLIPYLEGEIECMQSIKSEYVMQLIEVVEDPENKYLVCEYCNGGNLFEYQAKQKNRVIGLQKSLQILSQVLKGLQQLHSQQFLHRDLKSQNILVKIENGTEIFKIADFGFARREEDTTGTILGTGKFMAPEIYNDQKYGYGVDMWAIGVILFYMLNGQYPFNPRPENQINDIKAKCPFSYTTQVGKSKKKLIANCTPQLEDLFLKIFEFNPSKRINFHKIKEHKLFIKYFSTDTKQFTSSSILYAKEFKGKNQMGLEKKIQNKISEEEQESSEGYKSNIVSKKNFKNEVEELEFYIHHTKFIYALTQYFRNEKAYLPKWLKSILRYNILKVYIIQATDLLNLLRAKKVPEDAAELNWKKFMDTKQFETLVKQLNNDLLLAEIKFEQSYHDLKLYHKQITSNIPDFQNTYRDAVTEKHFDQFKKTHRQTTAYTMKLLNQIQNKATEDKKQTPKLIDVKARIFLAHIINQVFWKSELKDNFKQYFEWKKAKKVDEDVQKFNFESFDMWLNSNQKASLSKTVNFIFKKYF